MGPRISSIQTETCPPGLVPSHSHAETHACFVLAGEMIDREWPRGQPPAVTAELIVSRAGAWHEIETGPVGLQCVIVASPSLAAVPTMRRRTARELYEPLRTLLRSMRSSNPARRRIAEAAIIATVGHAGARSPWRGPPGWIEEARDALARRAPMSLAGVAAAAGVHRATLARRFRAAYGLSPETFVQLQRLGRAVDQLVGGSSIAMAALEVGFADQAHMTRAWRRHLGSTPGRWAARHATIVQGAGGATD